MMPGETGFEFARSIRQTSTVPILMLTARDAAESRITGLEIGADDYVAKPFEPRELSLRIANILKRAKPAAAPPAEIGALRPVRLSHRPRRAAQGRRDHPSHRPRARDADACWRRVPGETVPRMALAGNGGAVNERAVDVQVNRLRRKIERDPANPLIVQTVRGIGYRLVVSP